MSEAWVYIDESQGPAADAVDPGKPFRVGALVVEREIGDDLIKKALGKLAADPDARGNATDEETLRRGYFHASLDSKNAHSWLSREIVAAPIDGAFSDMQWHFGRKDSGKYGPGELHPLMNLLAALTVTQDDYDAVHLVVARREGTFDEGNVADWGTYWRSRCLGAFAKQPNIPTRFPLMTIKLVGGDEPGVQVCDIVLWAVQRAALDALRATGNDDWLKRLGLTAWAGGGEVGGAQEQVSVTLGKGVKRNFLPNLSGGKPRAVGDLGEGETLILMREIEQEVVRVAALASGHHRVGHLANELGEVVTSLNGKPTVDDILKLASAFLLVCDTLPTYDPADAAAYVRVVERRRVAAAVVDVSQITSFGMAMLWSRSPR